MLFCELAGLERALSDVFDAQDADALGLDDLKAIAPEAWPNLTFSAHPAVRRCDFTTNADDIWRALHNEETPPAPKHPGETRQVIFYRPEGMATFRPMTSDEAMMWDEMARGISFSVLCEMLSIYGGEDEAAGCAAGYLQSWITAGMLHRSISAGAKKLAAAE